MQSVSGGAHWGGGMFISARDHARLGLLVARGGRWGEQADPARGLDRGDADAVAHQRQLRLSVVAEPRAPRYRSAPDTCVYAMGAGSNMIWIDPEHDLVAVLRWIDKSACSDFFARLTAAAT